MVGNGVIYVADSFNYRVVKWNINASSGELVAGGRGKGNSSDQLIEIANLVVDQNGTMYITDHSNRRVQQWFRGAQTGQTIFANILTNGIVADDAGTFYVSQWSENQVTKWHIGDTVGKVILIGLNGADRMCVD